MPPDRVSTRTVGGRYRLDEEIGRGGAGVVWRGEDTLLRRPVAVKEVQLHLQPAGGGSDGRDRVLREARAAARVSHPRLVTLFDVVEEDDRLFLVQELVPGTSLKEAVERHGPVPAHRAHEMALQLLAALEALHGAGIVHRDVKPGNVMLMPDGSVKLADLGIAAVAGDPDLTKTGVILGSPHYMAPEQALGERVDGRADLWSLGVTLFFATEGRPPFEGPTWVAMNKIVHDPLPDPVHAGPLAPLVRALAVKDRDARIGVGEARRMLGGATLDASPADGPRRATTAGLARQHQAPAGSAGRVWVAALLVVIALLVGGFALAATTGGGDDRRAASQAATATTSAGSGATTSSATSSRATTTTTAPATGTATFTNEEAGYSIAYPERWSVQRRGDMVDLVEPGTGTYLRIDWTDEPGPSPKGAWEEQERSFSQRQGYRRIQLTEETYQGHPASLWEYTYSAGGTDLHAYNLGFVTGDRGFALNFQTREQHWDEAQGTWELLKAQFTIRS